MKEWKGNSDSVRSRLAINKAHTTKGREQDDFYATDPIAIDLLLNGCSKWLDNIFCFERRVGIIWECACGTGNLAERLKQQGFDIIASDLKDRGYGLVGKDFLLTTRRLSSFVKIILTNPPYSLANDFILHALDILPEGGGIYRPDEYIVSLRTKALRNNLQQRHFARGVSV